MTWVGETLRSAGLVVWILMRAGAGSLRSSWGLALFSLGAAVAVWVVVQDVENPRETGVYPPGDQAENIPIEARNVPDGYLVTLNREFVRVRLEARADDFPDLRPSDFRATVDLHDAPTGESTIRAVHVTARRDGITVIDVSPAEVEVTLVPAARRSLDVGFRITGDLPDGFEVQGIPSVSPGTIEVYGFEDIVATIESVDIDVNLSGVRTNEHVAEGELVARNASGDALNVRFFDEDQEILRGSVSFAIRSLNSERSMVLNPEVTGDPAPGYRVVGFEIEPQTVTVTGPSGVLEGLSTDGLPLAPIDVTNASEDIETSVEIEAPSNVTPGRSSVVVRVLIEPICEEDGDLCIRQTWFLAPRISAQPPPGLALAAQGLLVEVVVSGPLPGLLDAQPADFDAAIDLSSATPGTSEYTASVTAPPGVTVVSVEPTAVTIVGAP